MANVVTFYNVKGGQGKTTLVTHYALFPKSYFCTDNFLSGIEKVRKKNLS